MRLVHSEFCKLYTSRSLFIILLLILLNPIIQLYSIKSSSTRSYSAESYIDICDTIRNMPEKDVIKYLEDKINGSELYQEQLLFQDILAEYKDVLNYSTYLSSFDEYTENISILNRHIGSSDFSVRNAKKTQQVFSRLDASNVIFFNSKGILQITDCDLTNYLALIIILLISIALVSNEKEEDQLYLLRSNLYGRTHLMLAKLSTMIISTIVVTFLLFGMNIVIGKNIYGLGDLTRRIQSVYGYQGSPFLLSVGEYIIFYFLVKLLSLIFIGNIFLFICCKCQNVISVFATSFLMVGIEYLTYYAVPETSRSVLFKYCNLIYFIKTEGLFSKYINCNIFNRPVNIWYIYVVMLSVLNVIFIYHVLISLNRPKEMTTSNKFTLLSNIFLLNTQKHTSLLLHEGYKTLIVGRTLPLIIVILILSITLNRPLHQQFDSITEIYYKEYMDKLYGKADSNTNAILQAEQAKFDLIDSEIDDGLKNGDSIEFLNLKYKKELLRKDAFSKAMEHTTYLEKKHAWYLYDKGYQILTNMDLPGNRSKEQAIIFICLIIIISCTIYGIDYNNGEFELLCTTIHGRKKLSTIKKVLGILHIVVVWSIIYISHLINVFQAYGTKGINAPANSIEDLSALPHSVTIIEYIALLMFLRLVCGIIVLTIISVLYKISKNSISVIITSILIFLLPLILVYLNVPYSRYFLLNPLVLGILP